MQVRCDIRELRELKSNKKPTDTAVLDLLENKTEVTLIGRVRDGVAKALAGAERIVSTKK